jgi:hypothetical protein
MSNLKQLRPIDPNSEANDGPSGTSWTAAEMESNAASRARQTLRAMARNSPSADPTASPRRESYQRNLRIAIECLRNAAELNPNEEHAFLTMVVELKNIYEGR